MTSEPATGSDPVSEAPTERDTSASRARRVPGPAAGTGEELARLHALMVALLHLRPRAGDRILDLGTASAGAADLVAHLGLDMVTVACPQRAKRSFDRGGSRLLAEADALPLATGVCDHALCLDIAHSLGNRRRVLREVHRVLRSDGRAVIAAPGGDAPEGLTVDTLLVDCAKAGFVRPRLRPLSYVVPDFEIGRGRWGVWERYARSRRPWRNWNRLRRVLLDAFATSRREIAFEDALGIELIRLVKGAMDRYPLVVVTKSA